MPVSACLNGGVGSPARTSLKTGNFARPASCHRFLLKYQWLGLTHYADGERRLFSATGNLTVVIWDHIGASWDWIVTTWDWIAAQRKLPATREFCLVVG
jgi:hypothetical protein